MRKKISAGLFVFLCPIFLYAGGLDLTLLHGSRYVGLGGQQIALAADAYAPFYSPASMMGINKGAVAVNFNPLFFQYRAPIGADNNQRG